MTKARDFFPGLFLGVPSMNDSLEVEVLYVAFGSEGILAQRGITLTRAALNQTIPWLSSHNACQLVASLL